VPIPTEVKRLSSPSPSERSLRGRYLALKRWSRPGAREEQAVKIRAARLAHHENLVDPDGVLDLAERRKLADNSLKAEMAGLALKSAKARRARADAAIRRHFSGGNFRQHAADLPGESNDDSADEAAT
jgi:hypothetical protein